MNILEVREGFIKFEADEDVNLSSFVQVKDDSKSYIAQVIQIKSSGNVHIAYAKILFLNSETIESYDGSLPDKYSKIEKYSYDFMQSETLEPVIIGKTFENENVLADASVFDNKMLVSVDDIEQNNIFVKNFAKQLNNSGKNVIIIDSLGVIKAKKYIAGVDFKIPLDIISLKFLYEDCLKTKNLPIFTDRLLYYFCGLLFTVNIK